MCDEHQQALADASQRKDMIDGAVPQENTGHPERWSRPVASRIC